MRTKKSTDIFPIKQKQNDIMKPLLPLQSKSCKNILSAIPFSREKKGSQQNYKKYNLLICCCALIRMMLL